MKPSMLIDFSLAERIFSISSGSMTTYWSSANSYPLTIWSAGTSPWTGQLFLYWMRLWQSLWSWLREMRPPPLAVAVYALTGTATRENWTKPFQTVRDAMTMLPSPIAGLARGMRRAGVRAAVDPSVEMLVLKYAGPARPGRRRDHGGGHRPPATRERSRIRLAPTRGENPGGL